MHEFIGVIVASNNALIHLVAHYSVQALPQTTSIRVIASGLQLDPKLPLDILDGSTKVVNRLLVLLRFVEQECCRFGLHPGCGSHGSSMVSSWGTHILSSFLDSPQHTC